MFALVLAIGLVACGSSTEEKAASESVPVMKAFVDGSKAVIDMYKAAKTAEEITAADEANKKLMDDMLAKQGEIQKKFEKVDAQKLGMISSFSNAVIEYTTAMSDINLAKQAANDALAKAKKDKKDEKKTK